MAYGNIPILTCVGGNKEVVVNGNGSFVSDFSDISEIAELMDEFTVSDLKEKNRRIQFEMFSEKAFLEYYYNMIEDKLKSRRKN